MTDPFALLPLAVAARGGSIDGIPAHTLVAAGLTLLQRSAPLVRALARRRAALLLPTSPAYLVALAASEGRGAVLMNPLASPLEVEYQIADAGVGAVFTIAALAPLLPAGFPHVLLDSAPLGATVVIGGTARAIDLGSHYALDVEGDPDAPGDSEEAIIVYTSALYGRPLGAILTHRNLLANARATVDAAAMLREERVLAALPFSHLFGLVVSGVSPLLAGAQITTMPRFQPVKALEILESDRTTMFVGVPAMFISLLSAMDRRGTGLAPGALRLSICGGAVLAEEVQDRWFEATGTELRQGYGLTEASPIALFNSIALPNGRGTLGSAYPGVEITIRDPNSFVTLPDGATGEICIRGDTVFAGYLQSREGPPAVGLELRDGWLRTGDLAMRRANGSIVFRGLAKAMFTRNGFNIYPREIEAAVAELSGVRSASVTAVPDPLRENDIALSVTGAVNEASVRAWCQRRLSAYKQPGTIVVAP